MEEKEAPRVTTVGDEGSSSSPGQGRDRVGRAIGLANGAYREGVMGAVRKITDNDLLTAENCFSTFLDWPTRSRSWCSLCPPEASHADLLYEVVGLKPATRPVRSSRTPKSARILKTPEYLYRARQVSNPKLLCTSGTRGPYEWLCRPPGHVYAAQAPGVGQSCGRAKYGHRSEWAPAGQAFGPATADGW